MPLDIMATHFLRDPLAGDTDGAQALGALELDEGRSGAVYLCLSSKYEYGSVLRDVLTRIGSRKDNHGSEKISRKN